MSTIKHIVIAAAGMGTRMGSETPKCLIEFNGKPLIEHLLTILHDCKDIRIVVGHNADKIISFTQKIRKDIIYIINNSYMSTTTLSSYMLGSRFLKDPVCYMDADIYFNPDSLKSFFEKTQQRPDSPLIGVTPVKTRDCVYARLNKEKDKVMSFSRLQKNTADDLWEWANIAYLPDGVLSHDEGQPVYQILADSLPLPAFIIDSYEMDTPEDMTNAIKALDLKVPI